MINNEVEGFVFIFGIIGLGFSVWVVFNFFFDFKQNRCKHDLLIKKDTVDAYSQIESEKVWLTYYRCEHCEKLIKKTTLATVKGDAESLKEEA